MAKDINLLPRLVDAEVKRSEYKRYGSVVSFGLIGLVLVMALGLFVFSLLIGNSIKQTNQEIANHEKSVTDNLDKEIKIRALNSKMVAIKPILQAPNYMSQVISKLGDIGRETSGLDITEITVEQGKVTFKARVIGSEALKDFISALLDPLKGGKNFSRVVLTSLVRSSGENEYRFGLDMNFTPSKEDSAVTN